MTDWTPVSEEMPPEGKLVLVYDAWNGHQVMMWRDSGWWDAHDYYHDGDPPTHWMLLPEPPEADKR